MTDLETRLRRYGETFEREVAAFDWNSSMQPVGRGRRKSATRVAAVAIVVLVAVAGVVWVPRRGPNATRVATAPSSGHSAQVRPVTNAGGPTNTPCPAAASSAPPN